MRRLGRTKHTEVPEGSVRHRESRRGRSTRDREHEVQICTVLGIAHTCNFTALFTARVDSVTWRSVAKTEMDEGRRKCQALPDSVRHT